MKQEDKIIELGVEGGSVSIYRFFDDKGDDWYYHHTLEMSYDDLGLNGTDKKSKDTSMSFAEAMLRMINEYKNVMSFYPVSIDIEFKSVLIEFLKGYKEDIDMNKDRWFELLEIDESELDNDILKSI